MHLLMETRLHAITRMVVGWECTLGSRSTSGDYYGGLGLLIWGRLEWYVVRWMDGAWEFGCIDGGRKVDQNYGAMELRIRVQIHWWIWGLLWGGVMVVYIQGMCNLFLTYLCLMSYCYYYVDNTINPFIHFTSYFIAINF